MWNKTVRIVRLEENENYGTFGVLLINAEVQCFTLEPPDYMNAPMRSCIPAQQYLCSMKSSPTFGPTYEVRHVPGRSNVLFHPGNLVENTKGCILVGESIGELRGDRAVLGSRKAFVKLMKTMEGTDTFHLTIIEHY